MKLFTTLTWHDRSATALPAQLLQCLPVGCRISQPLAPHASGHDLFVEHDADSLVSLDELYRQLAGQATLASYQVEQLVEKDHPSLTGGTGENGRQLITCWRPRTDLSLDQVRRRWDGHVPLANRIHVGCLRYVRNWVLALARASGDFPPIYAGIAVQYYASAEDLAERMFDTPASVDVIQRDVEAFIDTFEAHVCKQWLHAAHPESEESGT